jgi:hypothetical protein
MRSLDEKNDLARQGPFLAPSEPPIAGKMFGSVLPSTASFATGVAAFVQGGTGEIPASQTTIRKQPQCTL